MKQFSGIPAGQLNIVTSTPTDAVDIEIKDFIFPAKTGYATWHSRAVLPYRMYHQNDEIAEWLLSTLQGRTYFWQPHEIWFENPDDAVMFVLVWG